MVVPRPHLYIYLNAYLCVYVCVNMCDFMWSILGFLTLYPLNSINSHYTIYIMYRIIYIIMYIIVYPLFTIVDHQVFSISFAPWTRFLGPWTARWGWQHFQSAPAEPRQCPPGDPRSPGGTAIFSYRNFCYPLVNCPITMERSTMFHGKINYKW